MSARKIAARMKGDDFQARYFWVRALQLLTSDFVERVELESTLVNVVDDVVVFYKGATMRDDQGHYEIDACQLKYHVTQNGAFSCDALLDPTFTHTKEPLLIRLYGAYLKLQAGGKLFRLRVVSPWGWDHRDPLAKCLSTEGHFLANFYDDGPRTIVGKKRLQLAAALGIDEDEFCALFRTLRFETWALSSLKEVLCASLKLASCRPVVPGQLHSPYDDLARKLLGPGHTSFNAEFLMATLQQEGLLLPVPSRGQVTLRSRLQWAKKPLETQSAHLDLCSLFDERFPLHKDVWTREVPAELRSFIAPERLGDLPQPIELFFDCHLSVAFAAGSLLHPKCGLRLVPIQKVTGRGYDVWACPDDLKDGLWCEVDPVSEGTEVVVAVSVTHDVLAQVLAYMTQLGVSGLPVVALAPRSGPGPLVVKDACEAWSLGTAFPAVLRAAIPKRCQRIHLFYAGPAALAFICGAHLGGLPPIQLYEHDFEGGNTEGHYYPSVSLPLS